MPAPAWEDLDAFLSTDEFAVTAVLQPEGGPERELTGIFDEPFLNAELGEYDLDTVQPRFLVKASEVRDVARGDTLTVGGRVLDVLSAPQWDGTGMATLVLAPRAG